MRLRREGITLDSLVIIFLMAFTTFVAVLWQQTSARRGKCLFYKRESINRSESDLQYIHSQPDLSWHINQDYNFLGSCEYFYEKTKSQKIITLNKY